MGITLNNDWATWEPPKTSNSGINIIPQGQEVNFAPQDYGLGVSQGFNNGYDYNAPFDIQAPGGVGGGGSGFDLGGLFGGGSGVGGGGGGGISQLLTMLMSMLGSGGGMGGEGTESGGSLDKLAASGKPLGVVTPLPFKGMSQFPYMRKGGIAWRL